MVLAAPRSAKLIETHGARFTLLCGYFFCLLGFLTMLLLWEDGSAYWQVGLGLRVHRPRRRAWPARPRRTRSPDPCRCGARGWRRRPPTSSATSAGRSCSRSSARCSPPGYATAFAKQIAASPNAERGQHQRRGAAHEVVLERGEHRDPVPAVREADHQRGEDLVRRRRQLGLHRGDHRDPPRRRAGVLHVPGARRRGRAPRRVPRRGHRRGHAITPSG